MKKYLNFIIPLIAVAVCSLFIFTTLDFKVADWFQRTLKSTEKRSDVVMVAVDDITVEKIGTFPFSREIYAEVNNNLKDLGAESVVYDLSFLDKSEAKIDEKYVNKTLPEYVQSSFDNIDEAVTAITDGFGTGALTAEDSSDAYDYISSVIDEEKDRIDSNISYVLRDVDVILANSIKDFKTAYLTLTMNDSVETTDEENEYLSKYVALQNVKEVFDTKTPRAKGVEPAILELLKNARSAGFVNAPSDKDGYLRRVDLVYKYKGNYYGQLAFVPVLERFGNPAIEISKRFITLKDCKLEDGTVGDIKIPRDEYGSVLAKYPKCLFNDYNIVSMYDLYQLTSNERSLLTSINDLDYNGYFENWDNPLDLYNAANYIKGELNQNGEDEENGITYAAYKEYRNAFFENLSEYFSGKGEESLLELYGDDEETVQIVKENLAMVGNDFNVVMSLRSKMKDMVQNAICIIGTTATSTTDFGLTQYEDHYPNPGLHYTIANMLLTQDFVDDSPIWISFLIAVILCLAYGVITIKVKSTGKQIIIGIVSIVVTTGLLLLFFIITKTYVGTVIPVTSLFITFLASSISGYLTASHQKRFIQGAFSQCLSPDVVNEIIAHPDSFKLGGQKVQATPIFTDIQKFSGFSELLTAGQLVALLNFYLTKMSDIIMEQGGTVDKFEGDAIVAFVGAPIKIADHAARACLASIKMKKAEVEMNKYIEEIAAAPKPDSMDDELYDAFCIMVKNRKTIFTRIGLNSGEIIAGYMGSEGKKNYTMMGNNVNLASRLEGVNKQYRTNGILMSAATRKELGDKFIVRSLDRVQVVNVVTPIRLYELLDVNDGSNMALVDYVNKWEKVLKVFEAGDYPKARQLFAKLSEMRPEDNVAKYYIELIDKYFSNGKEYPTDMDDAGVAFNPKNPEDMNPDWVGTEFEIKGTFRLLQK